MNNKNVFAPSARIAQYFNIANNYICNGEMEKLEVKIKSQVETTYLKSSIVLNAFFITLIEILEKAPIEFFFLKKKVGRVYNDFKAWYKDSGTETQINQVTTRIASVWGNRKALVTNFMDTVFCLNQND